MLICAVIVSFNSDKVFRCYESIREQINYCLIVDNATSNSSIISKLKELSLNDEKLKLLLSSENKGVAWALNQGYKYAKEKNCDWLITLDQDSELLSSCVGIMLENYAGLTKEEQSKAGIFGCKYLERQFGQTSNFKIQVSKNNTLKENILTVQSGNFIKISVFEKAGLFCEKLFIDYVDVEFYYRVLKYGLKNYEAQNVFLLHEFGASQKKFGFHITNQPPFRRYYIARNSAYFFKEYVFIFPYAALRVLFGGTIGGAAKILLFEKDKLQKYKYILLGIKDALLNKYGKLKD